MTKESRFTDEQNDYIETIVKRIRAGLKREADVPFEEPAHLFRPEAASGEK